MPALSANGVLCIPGISPSQSGLHICTFTAGKGGLIFALHDLVGSSRDGTIQKSNDNSTCELLVCSPPMTQIKATARAIYSIHTKG